MMAAQAIEGRRQVHTLSDFMTLLGLSKAAPRKGPMPGGSRHVMVHVTIDAQHATPLRRSLVRDCAGEPWTMRVTPLRDAHRVRLTLIVPKAAIGGAIARLADLAPSAQVSSPLDVPDAPSDAWRNLMDRSVHRGGETHEHPHEHPHDTATPQGTLATLLSADHVLLGADAASRDALFDLIGGFLERRHGLSAQAVSACLAAREALGSTALGEGVAVPHGQLDEAHEPMALYVRPRTPIAFSAPDGKPVSDVIALFVPERVTMTHLHLLGEIAEHFCDQRFRGLLRECSDADAVCRLFAASSANHLAH
ncbi:nitrogen regulatory IIA protein [Caballeronia cordobensis]|uniref:Nitrogen regulatory IIA protein n=1 Tax=Caballeronia cordobensis TaxID=1353886 RepID=A0A158H6V5_CABCO|nr:nitrogen regulatory IIA protein [Caballeronia cordobensis]